MTLMRHFKSLLLDESLNASSSSTKTTSDEKISPDQLGNQQDSLISSCENLNPLDDVSAAVSHSNKMRLTCTTGHHQGTS